MLFLSLLPSLRLTLPSPWTGETIFSLCVYVYVCVCAVCVRVYLIRLFGVVAPLQWFQPANITRQMRNPRHFHFLLFAFLGIQHHMYGRGVRLVVLTRACLFV